METDIPPLYEGSSNGIQKILPQKDRALFIKKKMHQCIYCKKLFPNNRRPKIPREHVISKMIGLFGKDTMTLVNRVCQECNNYFSKLELVFGRDSVYGVLYRAISGLLSEKRFSDIIQKKRKKLSLRTYSPVHGNALVDIELDSRYLFKVKLAEQFILLNSTKGICIHFPSDQLPHKCTLDSLGLFPPSIQFLGPSCVLENFPHKANEIRQKLMASGFKPQLKSSKVDCLPPFPDNSKLMFSSEIDDVIARVIAKIAFNYFAYHFDHLALSEYFDAIRNYILYDLKTDHTIVRITHRSINGHVHSLNKDNFGYHTIFISHQEGRIMAKIILFNHNIFDITI
ncbi:TPA: HNH endonuclease, partial [Legionella anisa]